MTPPRTRRASGGARRQKARRATPLGASANRRGVRWGVLDDDARTNGRLSRHRVATFLLSARAPGRARTEVPASGQADRRLSLLLSRIALAPVRSLVATDRSRVPEAEGARK